MAADYSQKNPRVLDETSRRTKAKKILKIVEDSFRRDPKSIVCLDVGCSGGIIDRTLAGCFKQVVGVDVDRSAVDRARAASPENASFLIGDGMALAFKSCVFDLVICNHTYEHVPCAEALFSEVRRILKPGGICYFAAPNKFSPIEGHYHLPFLSWLPRRWADRYVRWSGKGERYEEQCRSLWGLRRLASGFQITDYTLRTIRDPARFEMLDVLPVRNRFLLIMLSLIARVGYHFLPTYIWVLKKGEDASPAL